jgi:hypothetical protein
MMDGSTAHDMDTTSAAYDRQEKKDDWHEQPNRLVTSPAQRAASEDSVADLHGPRTLPRAEGEALLNECMVLAFRRFDAALWPALEDLRQEMARDPTGNAVAKEKDYNKTDIAAAVRSKPGLFLPCFREALKQSFERRREGMPRGQPTNEPISMAVVEHGTHIATVALKSAVLAMREATNPEASALDLRVRELMGEETTDGVFDNPFSSDYLCDALGTACRELWMENDAWRPIMRRLVRVMTPHIVELHRDINLLLKERGILPELNVYTYAARANGQARSLGGRALYQKLVDLTDHDIPGSQAAHSVPSGVASLAAAGHDTQGRNVSASGGSPSTSETGNGNGSNEPHDAQLWTALIRALTYLQHAAPDVPQPPNLGSIDGEALREGTGNQLRILKETFVGKAGSALDRVTIDIVAGVLDCVFDNPHLPDEIKTVFGRLQIPVLKAAVMDRRVLSEPTHPVRRLLENLVSASIDLQPQSPRGRALIEFAQRIAIRIRDEFDNDLNIFEIASGELDTFLNAGQTGAVEWLAQEVNQTERSDARGEAQAVLDSRRAKHSVPPGVQAFLDHEIVERLATISLAEGRESPAWEDELAFVDQLLWSIEPKSSAEQRKKLIEVLPSLLRAIDRGWEEIEPAQARRRDLLLCLFEFHLRSLKIASQDPATGAPATEEPSPLAKSHLARSPEASQVEPDDYDDQVRSLNRGDWCEFMSEETKAKRLARLAWRSTLRRRLLFCYGDDNTALVHTPESLANAFRSGHAAVALEGVPLFDRAMTRLIATRSGHAGSAIARAEAIA